MKGRYSTARRPMAENPARQVRPRDYRSPPEVLPGITRMPFSFSVRRECSGVPKRGTRVTGDGDAATRPFGREREVKGKR
jgi:hypothetical protein